MSYINSKTYLGKNLDFFGYLLHISKYRHGLKTTNCNLDFMGSLNFSTVL